MYPSALTVDEKRIIWHSDHGRYYLFVKTACGEQDIVATTSVPCMCVLCVHTLCIHPDLSGHYMYIYRIHGFQNNLAWLLCSRSKSAILNICSGILKVKVTLVFQMIKWS